MNTRKRQHSNLSNLSLSRSPKRRRLKRSFSPFEHFIQSPTERDIDKIDESSKPYYLKGGDLERLYSESISSSIDYLIDKYSNSGRICNASDSSQTGSMEIFVDIDEYQYEVRQEMISRIYSGSNPLHTDLILIPVLLINIKENSSHQCLCIVNHILQTIEFFDPHGSVGHRMKYGNCVLELLKIFFNGLKGTPSYSLLNLEYTTLQHGLQWFQDRSSDYSKLSLAGFCVAWSTFYAELRIKYPRIDCKELFGYYTPIFDITKRQVILKDIIKNQSDLPDIAKPFKKFIIEYTLFLEKRIQPYYEQKKNIRKQQEERNIKHNTHVYKIKCSR